MLTIAGCTTSPAHPSPAPPSPSASSVDTLSPTPSASPNPTFPVVSTITDDHLLDGGAAVVVARLYEITGRRPALKLDLTATEVIMTVLTKEGEAKTYRWQNGVIEIVDSDVLYLKQATFDPRLFPLNDLRLLFDTAALLGAKGSEQRAQVVQYANGGIYLSIATQPESKTVFFHSDGTAVPELGLTSATDIAAGLAAVTRNTGEVLALGFNPTKGYWARIQLPEDVIENRFRRGAQPTYSAQRNGSSSLEPFDPKVVDPALVTRTLAKFRKHDKTCSIEIDNRFELSEPVLSINCDGSQHYTDLSGIELTDLLD